MRSRINVVVSEASMMIRLCLDMCVCLELLNY